MHKIEFEVRGPGDINRVFILTGELATTIHDQSDRQVKETISQKLNPVITKEQFRRAIATVSPVSVISLVEPSRDRRYGATFHITGAEADWDDESERIELRAEIIVQNALLGGLVNQVIVLAKM